MNWNETGVGLRWTFRQSKQSDVHGKLAVQRARARKVCHERTAAKGSEATLPYLSYSLKSIIRGTKSQVPVFFFSFFVCFFFLPDMNRVAHKHNRARWRHR